VAIADSATAFARANAAGLLTLAAPNPVTAGQDTLTLTVISSLAELSCGSRQPDVNSTAIGRPASQVCQRPISIQAFTRGRSRWP
jgi:hypothetical protein